MNLINTLILVGKWNPLSYASDIFVVENYAYVLGDVLEIIDITDPTNPQLIGSYDGLEYHNNNDLENQIVVVEEDYAYVADNNLKIFDISDRTNPILISYYDSISPIRYLTVERNYLYFTDIEEGLTILDISDVNSPQLIGSYDHLYAKEIAVVEDYAYIAIYYNLKILDISDRTNPQLILSY